MRRLLVVAGLAAAAWWFLTRRRPAPVRVVVGYADGSAIELPDGSLEQERLVASARDALRT
jgi:hypothetical protein